MPGVCAIPPEFTIYDRLLVALNERRVVDAMNLYTQMTFAQRTELATRYPEIYANYIRAAIEFLR